MRPASIAALSGFPGESSAAISSAFTYTLQLKLGNIERETVVLPAPLHPDMIKSVAIAKSLTMQN
jgi:hypothetical protein